MKLTLIPAVAVLLLVSCATSAGSLGTAFTYQGQLTDAGALANGSYDLQFRLYDAASGGDCLGAPVTTNGVVVANGLFSVTLDFGAGVFSGEAFWLEIAVQSSGGISFSTLSPRQRLTPVPYALYAPSAAQADAALTATSALAAPWSGLAGVPAGFADGMDNDTLYGAGAGLQLSGTQFSVSFAGSGSASTTARSDHDHASLYAALMHDHDGTYSLLGHAHAAADITSGTLADARLSANVALLNAHQAFGGSNRFTGVVQMTNTANTIAGSFSGSGSGLSGLNPANLSAGIAGINITGSAATAATAATAAVANGVANNAVTAAGIAPGQVVKSLNGLRDSVILAAGNNLTLTPSAQTLTLATPADWHLSGNTGTTPGTHFLGTADNQPLELKVNSVRSLRLEPAGDSSDLNALPDGALNLIGGAANNTVATGVVGATISGGGATNANDIVAPNSIAADYASIGGGVGNTIETMAHWATLGGGAHNRIEARAQWAAMGGGAANIIGPDAWGATIAGGVDQVAGGLYATVGGGTGNAATNAYATVPGGRHNVGGGTDSFAAGRRAQALHDGAFVWADSNDADFASTGANQFLIRASGGVGIGTQTPATELEVLGIVTARGFSGSGAGLTDLSGLALASGSVTSDKIADGTLTAADVSANAFWNAAGNAGTTPATHFLGTKDNQPLVLRANNVEAARLASNGNLGLGTTAPAQRLDVAGNIAYSGQITKLDVAPHWSATLQAADFLFGHPERHGSPGLALTDDGGRLVVNFGRDWSQTALGGTVVVDPHNQNDGSLDRGLSFGGGGEGIASRRTPGANQWGLDFYTDGQSRLSIGNSGNVGIGTVTPAHKLDIAQGGIDLDNTTKPAAYGVITKDGTRFMHDFNYGNNGTVTTQGRNTFLGENAGNFMMGITATATRQASFNTGVGYGVLTTNTTGYENTAQGAYALYANMAGYRNTAIGYEALYANQSGNYNTAHGVSALRYNTTGFGNTADGAGALYANTTGYNNTASGRDALFYNTEGHENTAHGYNALHSNTTGFENTAHGASALYANTTGFDNTAIGYETLYSNTTGYRNTANGTLALHFNTTGSENTAHGVSALRYNTTGSANTAIGFESLLNNTTGSENTAHGASALYANTTGYANTANGAGALLYNTTGYANTANGMLALHFNKTGSGNTANGVGSLHNNETGNNNIALGYGAGEELTTGDNNIAIGHPGLAAAANTIWIGEPWTHTSTYIAGVYDTPVSTTPVCVNADGRLGTVASSRRYKQDIHDMGATSEVLLSLRPVTFHYRPDIDPNGTAQFGLIAEEVDQLDPRLVVRDEKHGIYTVRYEAVNAMLLNEFLKQYRKIEEQGQTLVAQRQALAVQDARLQVLEQSVAELKTLVKALAQKANGGAQ